MSDKRSQLESLRIDRSGQDRASGAPAWVIASIALLIGLALGGAGAFFLLQQDRGDAPQTAASAVLDDPAPSEGAREGAAVRASENGALDDAGPRQVLTASGYVTARRKATVSAEITGRLTEVLVEEGMIVEEGQLLAKLDDTLAQADLKLSQARLQATMAAAAAAKAELDEAQRVYARNKELAAQEFASKAVLTSAQARLEAAQAGLAQAKAQVEVTRQDVAQRRESLNKHFIRAPFAGVVVEKNAQPGEIISPISAGGGFTRTGVCTLVDMDSLEVEVDVNESYIGRVSSGQSVQSTLDAYADWKIPGSVIAIVPTADRSKATVKVRIGLDSKDPKILPEMGIKVTFLENQNG